MVPDVPKESSAVIFKRQPSMTKVLRSFETSRNAHSMTHRNLPGDSNLRKDHCENVINCDVSTHYNVTRGGTYFVYSYRYAPHNDVSVNDGPHIRRWSYKIIIL